MGGIAVSFCVLDLLWGGISCQHRLGGGGLSINLKALPSYTVIEMKRRPIQRGDDGIYTGGQPGVLMDPSSRSPQDGLQVLDVFSRVGVPD